MAAELDTKPYIEYDSIIGYRYIPNIRQTLSRPGGGSYQIVTNSAGIRASREYTKCKPAGIFRMLVFGDSYAAGQFVSNDQRFSELLERRVGGLEVINFALEGTGTDQQLLMYEQTARHYEHDLVLLFPFLQNIRRNVVEAREGYDPVTQNKILRAKPRFVLVDGELVLRNVPVPAGRIGFGGSSADLAPVDASPSRFLQVKSRLNQLKLAVAFKKLCYAVVAWEPFPEYRSSSTPEWQLMAAIIKRFKHSAEGKPLVVVPVFYDSYVLYRMARNYWDRFASLGKEPGIQVIDLLPHFKRIGGQAVRAYLSPYDCHFSAYGHIVVAQALQSELARLGFLR